MVAVALPDALVVESVSVAVTVAVHEVWLPVAMPLHTVLCVSEVGM